MLLLALSSHILFSIQKVAVMETHSLVTMGICDGDGGDGDVDCHGNTRRAVDGETGEGAAAKTGQWAPILRLNARQTNSS